MSVTENFDGVTAPAMPGTETWSAGLTTSASAPTGSISGGNALAFPTGVSGFLTGVFPDEDTSSGDVTLRATVCAPTSSLIGSFDPTIFLFSRGVATNGFSYTGYTCYAVIISWSLIDSVPYLAVVITRIDADDTNNGMFISSEVTADATDSDWYEVTFVTYGSSFAVYVERLADGQWMTTGGTWSADEQFCCYAVDSNITGDGYYGIAGSNDGGTGPIYLDDFSQTGTASDPLGSIQTATESPTTYVDGGGGSGGGGYFPWTFPDPPLATTNTSNVISLTIYSNNAEFSGFGFDLPDDAEDIQISVTVTRYSEGDVVTDESITLAFSGAGGISDNPASPADWPTSATPITYVGQTSGTWGMDPTIAQINSELTVVLAVNLTTNNDTVTANVTALTVTITWFVPAPVFNSSIILCF